MAVDSFDPIDGHPIFLDSGAPDIGVDTTEAAKYAALVGTRLIGTKSQRDLYPFAREGLAWFATDTGHEYVHDGVGWRGQDFTQAGQVSVNGATSTPATKAVVFDEPFAVAPNVVVGNYLGADGTLVVSVATNVTANGFTIRFRSSSGTTPATGNFPASWQATGRAA